MAKIHYVKDGQSPDGRVLSAEQSIPIEAIHKKLSRIQSHFFVEPPIINPGNVASELSEYRYVVVEIEQGDKMNGFYSKVGYYLLEDITPKLCEEKLNNA
jgi:hypothetical protein